MMKSNDLQKAAEDLRYLLDRAYPRKAALELVGNRYGLNYDQRHLLHRAIFSDADSESRRKKKIPVERIQRKDLVIDGYNVLITIEAALSDRPVVLGDDGFVRDISGLSGNFRKTKRTAEALELIFKLLKKTKPHQTLFLFDSPISRSGELAQEVRSLMQKENLPGDAMAVKVPERIMIGFPGTIATSDTAIIDRSRRVVDLAGHIIMNLLRRRLKSAATNSVIRWRRKRGPVGNGRKT
jgi:hypothetical protein